MVFLPFQGSVLEDQLNRLKDYESAVIGNKAIMDEMEKIHQAVQESMIFENRYRAHVVICNHCAGH